MFIATLAFGVASGLSSSIVALLVGSSFLTAFAAYIVGGLIGVMASILYMLQPGRAAPAKQPITQRS